MPCRTRKDSRVGSLLAGLLERQFDCSNSTRGAGAGTDSFLTTSGRGAGGSVAVNLLPLDHCRIDATRMSQYGSQVRLTSTAPRLTVSSAACPDKTIGSLSINPPLDFGPCEASLPRVTGAAGVKFDVTGGAASRGGRFDLQSSGVSARGGGRSPRGSRSPPVILSRKFPPAAPLNPPSDL